MLQRVCVQKMLDGLGRWRWWEGDFRYWGVLDLWGQECVGVSWLEFNKVAINCVWRVSWNGERTNTRRRKISKLLSRRHPKRPLSLLGLERHEDEVCFCKNHPRPGFEFSVWIPCFPFLCILRVVHPSQPYFYHIYARMLILWSSLTTRNQVAREVSIRLSFWVESNMWCWRLIDGCDCEQ